MNLFRRLSAFASSDIRQDILRLASATLAGRIIVLAATPIVTRIYSPSDFALLATYLGVVGILGAVACLRYDVAIPVADSDMDAASLLALALLSSSVVAVASMFLVLAAPQAISAGLGQPLLKNWLWLVPIGIFVVGSYSAVQFWTTRMRRFESIARTRLTQAAAGVAASLGLGWAGFVPVGLFVGNLLNIGAGGIRLALDTFVKDREILERINVSRIIFASSKYRRFPFYSVPEASANIIGIHMPIILVSAFATPEAGLLLLAQQIMSVPMALIGSSISQVYASRASGEQREGRLGLFTLNLLRRLIHLGIGPLIFAGIAAPSVFPTIFGSEWGHSGTIVLWMVPSVVLQFLAVPISTSFHVTSQHQRAMVLHGIGLVLRVGAVLAVPSISPVGFVAAAIIGQTAFFALYLTVVLHASGVTTVPGWPRVLVKASLACLPWMLAGLAFPMWHWLNVQ